MPAYTIEPHVTLPAVIVTWHEDFDFARDARPQSAAMREVLNNADSPIYYVMDLTLWSKMPFSDLIEATSIAARGKDANFHNSNNMGTLIVTKDPAVRISAEGLRSDAFGNANVLVFSSLDDALAHITEEAA